MRVPLSANQDDQVTANEEPKIATAVPRRILVVDDNEHAAEILAKWLNLEGHSGDDGFERRQRDRERRSRLSRRLFASISVCPISAVTTLPRVCAAICRTCSS